MKRILIAILMSIAVACFGGGDESSLETEVGRPSEGSSFEGTVTALGPNADDPERTFTAISDEGIAKVFQIASLQNLDVGDRVTLQYIESETYPQKVQSIRFHAPSGQ